MELIRSFERLGKDDAGIAGGKGASLGEMTQAGIPVPPGFVVLASAFERFLDEANLAQELDTIFHTVHHQEIRTVDLAAEKIQSLIVQARMPQDIADEILASFKELGTTYVAVRSSATAEDSQSAAWAGQLDTFLNTTQDTLLQNVQKCWASLFTPRAIFYRFEKGMHGSKISVAVVVQKMVQSEVSGIAFSVHPVTEDYNQLIIEVGFGLGEAIVSGQVTPDSFVVEKEPRRLLDKSITYQSKALWRAASGGNEWRELSHEEGTKPALSDEQALHLAEIVLRIEKHYGFPCDIEWAFEAGQYYITQSRPITTLSAALPVDTRPAFIVDKGSHVQRIIDTDWMPDWSARVSLMVTIDSCRMLDRMQAVFGDAPDMYLILYEDGVASGLIDTVSYERAGVSYAKKAQDVEFFKTWIARFRALSDETESLIALPLQEVIQRLPELKQLNKEYSAYQIASKCASNFMTGDGAAIQVRELEKARLYSEEYYKHVGDVLARIAEHFSAKKPQYTTTLLMTMSLEEMIALTRDGIWVPVDELSARYERSGLLYEGDRETKLSGGDVAAIRAAWLSAHSSDVLTGTSAYPGAARGRCRIVRSSTFEGFEDGDILVTSMTTPDFLPMMHKAGAIVTDVGGLLCHAAIVAREIKKPCVIGTKSATQVLKDGDLVEVDAHNGIIRKL